MKHISAARGSATAPNVPTAPSSPTAPNSSLRAVTAVMIAVMLSGCYTTTNTVTVAPLKTGYPVSASGQYIDAQGQLVTEGQYEVVNSFEFDRRVEAPRHESKESDLALEPELDRLVKQHRGDAVTDLKIVGTEYDTGSHGSAAGWKVLGWTFGLTGATFVVLGAALDDGDTGGGTLMGVGAVFAGLGLVSYLLSYTTDDPASWNIHVQGNVIKRGTTPAPSDELDETGEVSLSLPSRGFVSLSEVPPGSLLVPAPGFRPIELAASAAGSRKR